MTTSDSSKSRNCSSWTLKDAHRPAIVQAVAKALCRLRHFPRSIEEAVAPGRELWMRYLPDAEAAAEAFFKALDTLALTPSEMTCGKLNNGIPCTMPAGTRCPDCSPAIARSHVAQGEPPRGWWSFLRSVLEQGAAIQQDYAAGNHKGYEEYSARLDAAARERADEIAPSASGSTDEWHQLYTHAQDRLEEAEAMLKECVEGTVEDCTKWNRRVRAFLSRNSSDRGNA